jgi:hypothetical protein
MAVAPKEKKNGYIVVNFVTSKNLTVKSTMLPHHKIHKFTWTSPDGKTRNQTDNFSIDWKTASKYT